MTPKTFSIYIESQVREKNISHMDAILEYCTKNEVEPDSITGLIQKPLKDKIEANARDLNFLPKMGKLPV
jgi:hypothetical protein|tara:strand:+ start:1244 stop:1453 length:210 start_codon:yes stop_codon:yes gene_type:complete